MNQRRRLITGWFGGLALAVVATLGTFWTAPEARATESARPVILGVLAQRPRALAMAQWRALADYLNEAVPEAHFELQIYDGAEEQEAVRQHSVDILITHAAEYVRLVHQDGLSSPLATVIGLDIGRPIRAIGGAILVQAQRHDLETLADLQGKRVAVADSHGFESYMAQMAELQGAGVSPGAQISTGLPADRAIRAVLDGQADAAFVPGGLDVQMAREGLLDVSRLRTLHPQDYTGYPESVSTRLYPQWPVVAMPHLGEALATRVAGALLSLPHGGPQARSMGLYGFSPPVDYEPVREVMRALHQPPFDEPQVMGWAPFWRSNGSALVMGALLVLVAVVLGLREILMRRRMSSFSNAMGEGMFVLDRRGRVSYVNRAACELLGYTREQLQGRPLLPQILPPLRQSAPDDPHAGLDPSRWQQAFQEEAIFVSASGKPFPVEVNNKPVRRKGRFVQAVTVFSDISERKAQDAHVRHLAYHDTLTGLPNRRFLLERLQDRLGARNEGLQGALLFSDLDRFKQINDTLGHQTGDALLQSAAIRLQRMVGNRGLVARIGGDEFAVLLERLSDDPARALEQVHELADQVLRSMREPFSIGPQYHQTSVSIGIALFEGPEVDADELLKRADLAMYEAKAAGRNAIRLYDRDVAEQLRSRVSIEKDLKQALVEQQFRLYYQPQFDASGRLVGAEALIRWQHPQRGLVPPADFIPLAEENGLILPLGIWILDQACQQIDRWRSHPDLGNLVISVNLCAHQVVQANFVESVLAVLMATQADPRRLMLELTESVLARNIDDVGEKMKRLVQQGVMFSLDDFGTGYSSLAYLKRLPIHQLKIDASFVRDLQTDPNDAAITQTVIDLGRSLGLEVIAEGVETAAQRNILQLQGCRLFQGFLLGRPMLTEEFEARYGQPLLSTLAP